MTALVCKAGMERVSGDGDRERAVAQTELLAATQTRCQQLERDLTVRT